MCVCGAWETEGDKETWICPSCRKSKKMFLTLKYEGIRSWNEETLGAQYEE